MSSDLFSPGEDRQGFDPKYGPLGLNHTLRISGVAYFYDPNAHLWERGSRPAGKDYSDFLNMPARFTAEAIHDWMQLGAKVLPWTKTDTNYPTYPHSRVGRDVRIDVSESETRGNTGEKGHFDSDNGSDSDKGSES